MDTATIVTGFIGDELRQRNDRVSLGPDESLISTGILDSLALLKLILFIEERFSVKVMDGEVIPGNFETIARIAAFVDGKRQSGGD